MKPFRNRSTRVAEDLAKRTNFELAAQGWASLKEARTFLCIGESKLAELLREGEIVAGRIDRRRLVSVASLLAYSAKIIERRDRVSAA